MPRKTPPLPGIDGIPFAHAAEREFARLLTFYGVHWQYEPTTFPLDWDDQGRVIEAFTPDFYLPDQDLYIELTTKEQRLMPAQHRKIRGTPTRSRPRSGGSGSGSPRTSPTATPI